MATPGDDATYAPQTLAVRGGLTRSGFDETSEALFLTSGYVYESAFAMGVFGAVLRPVVGMALACSWW